MSALVIYTFCSHITLYTLCSPSLSLPPQSAINPLHHLNYIRVRQFGARRCNFQSCGIEKTVAGGRKMCCSVCYNGLPLLSLLARMAALADACAQYGWCACCAFSLPNAVCRYSVDKLRVCLHS